jgi:predicted outer membrane protein
MGKKDNIFIQGIESLFDIAASAGKIAAKNFLNLKSDERFDIEAAKRTFKKEVKKNVKAVADAILSDDEEEKNPEKSEAKIQNEKEEESAK